jgi:hypothetical protein
VARVKLFGIERVAASATEFLLERVTDLVFNDDGSVDGKGLDDRDVPTTSPGYHFGFYSRPNDGAVGVVVRFLGLSFLAAWRDKQFEMSLNKGECGMQNAFSASVLLDKNGNVIFNGGDAKVGRVGDGVDLGTFVHTPATGVGVTACSLVWTPPGGGTPQSLSGSGADITGKIKEGADKVKA